MESLATVMREFGVHIPVLEPGPARTAFFANGGGHVDNISENYPHGNIAGTDEGVWRRVRLVPFDVVIPAAERDEELGDRLALDAGRDPRLPGGRLHLMAPQRPGRAGGSHVCD